MESQQRDPQRSEDPPNSPEKGAAKKDPRSLLPAETEAGADGDGLYFFPNERVDEARVRWILEHGSSEERAWVISHLLRYAQWDDIWSYVSREEVREIFPQLELPEKLRAAWGRMLKVEAPVG